MKLKTFLRQAPLIAGAFATIFSVLFFVSCEATKTKTKKKTTPTLAFKLDAKGTTADFVEMQKNGGVTKSGDAGKEVYYQVKTPAADGSKYFTLTASSKSTGKVTYTLQKWMMDAKGKTTLEDAKKHLKTPADLEKGKVVFKSENVKGFFYLMANQEAKGNYKAAKEVKVLLLVGEVDVPPGGVMVELKDKSADDASDGFTNFATKVVLSKDGKTLTVDPEDGKKFRLLAKFNMAKFPKEAPLPTGEVTLSVTAKTGNELFETFEASPDSNSAVAESAAGTNPGADVKVRATVEQVAPYGATTLDLFALKKKS